jgi:hypothetical protein
VGTDAIRGLRDWQRLQATQQDQALKAGAKAWARLGELDAEIIKTRSALTAALADLQDAGVTADQAAAFLGVAPDELARVVTATKRRLPTASAIPPRAAAKAGPSS